MGVLGEVPFENVLEFVPRGFAPLLQLQSYFLHTECLETDRGHKDLSISAHDMYLGQSCVR